MYYSSQYLQKKIVLSPKPNIGARFSSAQKEINVVDTIL